MVISKIIRNFARLFVVLLMIRRKYFILVVLGLLVFFSDSARAQKYYNQGYRPKLTSVARSREGFNSEQFSFGVNALYYFGDAEVPRTDGKLPLVSDFSLSNINALAFFAYHKPFDEYVGLRCGASLGLLRGDNSHALEKFPGSKRKFTSVFLQPFVGVQIYPIEEYGFYIYAGVGIAASYFIKHEYAAAQPEEKPTFAFLPMGQASVGYAWNLTPTWRMDVHGTFEMGFCDLKGINLDGWPVRPYPKGSKDWFWSDGWFSVGVSFYFRGEKALPFLR